MTLAGEGLPSETKAYPHEFGVGDSAFLMGITFGDAPVPTCPRDAWFTKVTVLEGLSEAGIPLRLPLVEVHDPHEEALPRETRVPLRLLFTEDDVVEAARQAVLFNMHGDVVEARDVQSDSDISRRAARNLALVASERFALEHTLAESDHVPPGMNAEIWSRFSDLRAVLWGRKALAIKQMLPSTHEKP